ncbi:MAG: hypothetical protein ACE5I9_07310 [Candidatus Methylomirabilales bacterium]
MRKAGNARAIVGLCVVGLFVSAACSPSEGPEATAQSFIEQYYIHPHLPKAKALAYGLARRKIEEEEGLIREVTRGTGAADREVSYSLHETRKMGEAKIFYVYDITISVDHRLMKKRATIATGRTIEGWRVTNFHETDI